MDEEQTNELYLLGQLMLERSEQIAQDFGYEENDE